MNIIIQYITIAISFRYDEDDPPVLTSAGNTMYVEFITDFSITGGGFFATYEHVVRSEVFNKHFIINANCK